MTVMEKAMFGAGCFWGVEKAFRKVPGVKDVTVGYSGGHSPDPTYKEVCTGRTGHAEVALVEFDPQVTSFEKLLEVFWKIHDPTQVDRQGPDVGRQYRSAIFFFSPEQEKIACAAKDRLQNSLKSSRSVATEIKAAGSFYPAEEYHQRYFEKMGY